MLKLIKKHIENPFLHFPSLRDLDEDRGAWHYRHGEEFAYGVVVIGTFAVITVDKFTEKNDDYRPYCLLYQVWNEKEWKLVPISEEAKIETVDSMFSKLLYKIDVEKKIGEENG